MAAKRGDPLEERPLGIGLFDDRFDNPVACATLVEIRVEPPRSEAASASAVKNGSGLSFRARSSPSRPLWRYIKQGDSVSGVPRCAEICRPWFRRQGRKRIVSDEKKTAFLPCYTLVASHLILEVISMLRRFTLALAACCLSLSTLVAGQTRATTADLGGTIVDQSSAVLPGATVTAQNVDTNQTRSAITDERGRFLIPALAPGTYTVRAELWGFTPRTRTMSADAGWLVDVKLSLTSRVARRSCS